MSGPLLHHRDVTFRFCLLLSWCLLGCGPSVEPPHFLWSTDAQSLDNPFPDERLLVNGAVTLRPKWFQPFLPKKAITAKSSSYFNAVGTQARGLSAQSAFGATLLLPSEPLDPDSLQGSVARLVREENVWRVLERTVAVQHPRDVLAAYGHAFTSDTPEFLFARPGVPLPEGSDGLLVVLRGPKTRGGVSFGRGAAFASTKPELAQVATVLGVKTDDVLLTLPQHAGDVTSAPRALARWAETHPPTITIPAQGLVDDDNNGTRPVGLWRSTDADFSRLSPWLGKQAFARPVTHVGVVVIGELGAKDLRERGVIRPDWLADPSLAPTVPLRFVLTLPSGPKPAGGWPVVMGQHGVGGRNTPRVGVTEGYCLEWAEALARRGMGCIGIDAPEHGSRGTFTSFFSVEDLPALRDRFREMTFDLLQVERAVVTFDLDGDGAPDVAPRLRYFGNSMGAIMGAGFVPVSNRVSSVVLNVPGGGLSNVVMSRNLHDLIGLLIVGQTDLAFESPEYIASFPLFRAAAQPFFDPGDPIHFAASTSSDLAVLQQTGLGDSLIPLDTSVDLAAALRLQELGASTGTAPLRAFVRADPAKYLPAAEVPAYNGHNVMWDFAPVRDQALTFLETDGRVLLAP